MKEGISMKRMFLMILAALAALALACSCASAQADPYLRITKVPKIGNTRGVLRGTVFTDDKSKCNFGKYRVMLYLEVGDVSHGYTDETPWNAYAGYPKPTFGRMFTKVSGSGVFTVDVTTGGMDSVARSYTVLLVTSDATHRVVDAQRIVRYQGMSYAHSIDARSFRSEPTRYAAPAVKVQSLSVRAGKSASLPAVRGYAGSWSVEDGRCATVSGSKVRGLQAHTTTTLAFTVTKVLDNFHPHDGKVLGVGDRIEVKLYVTCSGCADRSVSLQKTRATVRMGKTFQIRPSGKNPCPWRRTLTYRSDNIGVATVSETGLVMPVSPGRAGITVTNVFGKTRPVWVTVKPA
jgi:hypothetical protein